MKKLLVLLLSVGLLLNPALPVRADDGEPETSITAPTLPSWTKLSLAVAPSARSDVALAYDTAREVAVMFGGYTQDGTELDETWEFDSATLTWIQRFPAHRPPPRYFYAMTYDQTRGVTVMFGGVGDVAVPFDDTWIWDGNDWMQVFPITIPAERWNHSMAYDSQRQVVVMFGGEHSYEDSVTWEWDGVNWNMPIITQPSWRYGSALSYDAQRNTTVTFGGGRSTQPYRFDETWERSGAGNWLRRFPQIHPQARLGPVAAYSPLWHSTILYGGASASNQFFNDTWAWTGQRWFKLPLDPHPVGRCGSMVYDSVLQGMLLYIGCSAPGVVTSETWLLH